MRCRVCNRTLVPEAKWQATPIPERDYANEMCAQGRGLCTTHYTAATRQGTLVDYELPTVRGVEVAEEWPRLVDPHRSQAANVRLIAPRLGMTESALERAVVRAKRSGLLEGAA